MPLAISVVPPLLAPLLTLLGAAPPAATPVDRWTPGAPATAVERAVAPGVWPLAPPLVVAGFDPPSTRWSAGHRGVDLQGLPGQQVRAAVAGTVSFAGTLAGRGVVVVTHGQTRTTYEPVLAWVDVGVAVAAGDPLGRAATARPRRACTGVCAAVTPISTRSA